MFYLKYAIPHNLFLYHKLYIKVTKGGVFLNTATVMRMAKECHLNIFVSDILLFKQPPCYILLVKQTAIDYEILKIMKTNF